MFKRIRGACLVFGMAALAPPVWAANCAERTSVVERLETKYSEHLTVGGLQKTNDAHSVMEIWASSETGTFTVLVTSAYGVSCIVAAGTNFFHIKQMLEPEGTAS